MTEPQVLRVGLALDVAPPPEDLAVELFARLSRADPHAPAALLDSSDHARTAAPARSRCSILAFSRGARAVELRHCGGVAIERSAAGETRRREDFFSWLRRRWPHAAGTDPQAGGPARAGEGESAGADSGPTFALGWVGWLGHELWHELDPRAGRRSAAAPDADAGDQAPDDARLFRATHAVVIDHAAGTLERQSLGEDPAWAEEVEAALQAALAAPAGRSATSAPASAPSAAPSAAPQDSRPQVTELAVRDSRARHLASIAAAQAEIREGTTYEICLTTAVTGRLTPRPGAVLDTIGLYRRLRAANRAPFTQLLRFGPSSADVAAPEVADRAGDGAVEILSTSPERFLSLDADGLARTEPIKGTRPRGVDDATDRALHADLAGHPKDRAENVMITDLARNDLSIHAVPGTLRTERLCAIESYPTVHQMVSTVSARTAPGVPHADVVAAAFPPGSMTGAPKLSTMEILDSLETGRRGPYSGVAGYFSTTGAADLSVLIRTLVLEHDPGAAPDGTADGETPGARTDAGARMHLGLGGAIVADSDPAAEWDEVAAKSAGVLGVLGVEFPG